MKDFVDYPTVTVDSILFNLNMIQLCTLVIVVISAPSQDSEEVRQDDDNLDKGT